MYAIDTIIVGLDLTEMDETLLRYTGNLAGLIRPAKIYFLNVQRELDVSDAVKDSLGMGDQPFDEYCEKRMRELVAEFFPDHTDYDVDFEVAEGNPATEVLKWTHIKEADLLIMGRKKDLEGSGVMPQQVTAKVRSSVLFVPEKFHGVNMENLLVPVDMSDYSRLAVEEALSIRAKNPAVKITSIFAFDLPAGYYTTGKSDEEFAAVLQDNYETDLDAFIDSFDAEHIDRRVVWARTSGIADTINQIAHDEGMDLIIMGAKGRTLASSLFLGSVTGKLVVRDNDIPLLVVKDKSQSFDFWEMIRSL